RGWGQPRRPSADENVLTWKPPAWRRRRRARRRETSSSMTYTNGERSSSRDEAEATRPSLSPTARLERVSSPRHALLVPFERADRPGRRGLEVARSSRVAPPPPPAPRHPSVPLA